MPILNILLTHGDSDMVDNDLFVELKVLRKVLPEEIKKPIELHLLKSVHDYYPNLWIAYRVLLTILVSVASAKRSFLKLKLMRT